MKTVLITGCAGRIGGFLLESLRETGRYRVIGTARNADPARGIEAMNLLDAERILQLTRGVDVIVHMAAYLGPGAFAEKALPNNVLGTYHLYEAMRQNGVGRMVNGSSNHVMGFYKETDHINDDSPVRPDSVYGLTKAMAETIGRLYSDKYGISCINIRIGSFSPTDEVVSYRRTRSWVSRRDLLQLVECCINAPESVRFLNCFGISNNLERFWDIEETKRILGYQPQDDGHDQLEEALARNRYGDSDKTGYMGADFVFGRE